MQVFWHFPWTILYMKKNLYYRGEKQFNRKVIHVRKTKYFGADMMAIAMSFISALNTYGWEDLY